MRYSISQIISGDLWYNKKPYIHTMQREPFTIGSYVHVVKRGARGLPIFKDDTDRWRCLLMLRHFNDEYHSDSWFRDLMDEKLADTLERASVWPEQQSIVSLLAFTFMHNHFHLLLKEIKEGGIPSFMGKIGKGMTLHANKKYGESGSMFQGPYRSRTVKGDAQFGCVAMYIMVKNVFELYPGGLEKAVREFDKAYEWALTYPYSSLMDYNRKRESLLIQEDLLADLFPNARAFRTFAKDYILGRGVDVDTHAVVTFE